MDLLDFAHLLKRQSGGWLSIQLDDRTKLELLCDGVHSPGREMVSSRDSLPRETIRIVSPTNRTEKLLERFGLSVKVTTILVSHKKSSDRVSSRELEVNRDAASHGLAANCQVIS